MSLCLQIAVGRPQQCNGSAIEHVLARVAVLSAFADRRFSSRAWPGRGQVLGSQDTYLSNITHTRSGTSEG